MLIALAAIALAQDDVFDGWPDSLSVPLVSRESHLRNVRQVTFGGQNAEAYWNLDGTKIVWQSTQPGFPDEQIFVMDADGSNKTLVSTGLGRCTCGYFSPDGQYVYFSSSHRTMKGKQPPVDHSLGYVWMVNPAFDLYRRDVGTWKLESVLSLPGYLAETTLAPGGQYMTFTSDFEGDLDIYRADLNGFGVKKLTDEFGYDGGPFVSWDGKTIVFRRSPLDMTAEERGDYSRLLADHMVRPGEMEVWIMNADGSNKRQITHLGGANFAPFLHPDGETIIFGSNHTDPRGREFELYTINVDGTGLERITFIDEFDGFPMFSRDGKKLIWASNRYNKVQGETNIFVADWVD
ncbi:MAG: PD40 domain-containing protein [Armatimonadetes bacterium]|nr:PD40 domain-containing protein [Armatimonadota bacterium]